MSAISQVNYFCELPPVQAQLSLRLETKTIFSTSGAILPATCKDVSNRLTLICHTATKKGKHSMSLSNYFCIYKDLFHILGPHITPLHLMVLLHITVVWWTMNCPSVWFEVWILKCSFNQAVNSYAAASNVTKWWWISLMPHSLRGGSRYPGTSPQLWYKYIG